MKSKEKLLEVLIQQNSLLMGMAKSLKVGVTTPRTPFIRHRDTFLDISDSEITIVNDKTLNVTKGGYADYDLEFDTAEEMEAFVNILNGNCFLRYLPRKK